MSAITLSSLHIYPIKSAAGINLSVSTIDELGLSFDRRFVLTDEQGRFITARTEHRLCLVQPSLTPSGLVLSAPGMPDLAINYHSFSSQYMSVSVWKDEIQGLHCHHEIDQWFSGFLGRSCLLFYFGERSERTVANSAKKVGFADGYPLLIISQASLSALNHKLNKNTVTMAHFRPNIVVQGTEAFDEDSWKRFKIGEVEFEVVKPCTRCIMTTVNPQTGTKNPEQEPLMTLKRFRQLENGEVIFGQNVIALNQGQVKAGDSVIVLERQSKPSLMTPQEDNQADTDIDITATSQTKSPLTINYRSWQKVVNGNNQDTVLEQGEENGLLLPYSCRGGMCGRCKLKLTKGLVNQLAQDGLSDEEQRQGYILACSSIPLSDITVEKP